VLPSLFNLHKRINPAMINQIIADPIPTAPCLTNPRAAEATNPIITPIIVPDLEPEKH